jgi:hypothetical protein
MRVGLRRCARIFLLRLRATSIPTSPNSGGAVGPACSCSCASRAAVVRRGAQASARRARLRTREAPGGRSLAASDRFRPAFRSLKDGKIPAGGRCTPSTPPPADKEPTIEHLQAAAPPATFATRPRSGARHRRQRRHRLLHRPACQRRPGIGRDGRRQARCGSPCLMRLPGVPAKCARRRERARAARHRLPRHRGEGAASGPERPTGP